MSYQDTSLDAIQARLSVLKQQMDCAHEYDITPGLVACKKCLASMTTCTSCNMPLYDGFLCDWCTV